VIGRDRVALGELRSRLLRAGKVRVEEVLTQLGAHCSPRLIHQLDSAVGYLAVGQWMRERGFAVPRRYRELTDLWDAVAAGFRDEKVLYLEFGVFEGNSIRYWAKLLRNPDSMLHGFDSFVGFPVDWTPTFRAGHYSTGGEPPRIDDPRVRFFKGWIEDTLPRYEWPEDYDRLVINFDADLYRPTALALEFARERIEAGTVLYFDELSDHEHELRAFSEFLDATHLQFRVLGASSELGAVAFECTGAEAA
jgi:hypothetical protein